MPDWRASCDGIASSVERHGHLSVEGGSLNMQGGDMRGERKSAEITSGSSPLGATVYPAGTNFSVFSRNALGVELLFFDREDDARPARLVRIDPSTNRTYHYWHIFVPGVRPGQIYRYRVEGPFHPANGLRFDPNKVLLPGSIWTRRGCA